jgi:carbonic anhydrase
VPGQAAAGDDASPSAAVPRLLAGTREFHHRTAPLVRPILTGLAHRQSPSHLFITCSDSRLVPSLITSSGPGDLFIVRNIGNLVPRHHDLAAPALPPIGAPARPGESPDDPAGGLVGGLAGGLGGGTVEGATAGQTAGAPHDDSVGAAIEYAMDILGVRTITVCGHSGCGAMSALLNGGVTADAMPRLWRWLRHGEATLVRSSAGPDPAGAVSLDGPLDVPVDGPVDGPIDGPVDRPLDRLCRANVLQQLDNLLTYPSIAALVESGRLELVGLYFDIATARVHVLSHDPAGRHEAPVGAG